MIGKYIASEKGQAVVLLAAAFIVLLGFSALAIDGGMIYADRRFAQNAADTAALAGGGAAALKLENEFVEEKNFSCGSSKVAKAATAAVTDAIYRAGDNGFLIDPEISDEHGVTVDCGVDNSGPYPKHYLDVIVKIKMETRTAFAHFVYGGKLENKVTAVSRVYPRIPMVYGNAIVSLNPAICDGNNNGANFHGSAAIYVEGGDIFSNGCLNGSGQPDVLVAEKEIKYGGDFDPGNTNWSPNPDHTTDLIPDTEYAFDMTQNCADTNAYNLTGNQFESSTIPLASGLYCVTGNVSLNGGTFRGDAVTIVMLDGELRINGNVTVQLTAPSPTPDPYPAVAGLLVYAPPTNHNDLQFNGTDESYFVGTILAPGSRIDLLGTGSQEAFKSQVIGWNVEVGGTADTYVEYDDDLNVKLPATLRLQK
jgi:hypothetical protein